MNISQKLGTGMAANKSKIFVEATETETEEMPLLNAELRDMALIEPGIGYRKFGHNPSGVEEEGPINQNLSPGIYFPDIAVQKILRNPDFDQQTLLNCRLVSVQWNETIKNTLELMRKITFQISTNVREFLNLPIVKSGKVKSVIFKNTSAIGSPDLSSLMDAISNSIEKVEFAFGINSNLHTASAHSSVFQSILQNCVNLQEIILTKDSIDDNLVISQTDTIKYGGILSNIKTTTEIAACNKIKYLSVNLEQFVTRDWICNVKTHSAGFKMLLFKLPKLKEIKLYGWCEDECFSWILTSLCNYIRNFGSTLELKKLALSMSIRCDCHEVLIKLLILCAVHEVTVEFVEYDKTLSTIYLNDFLGSDLDLSDIPREITLTRHRPLIPMEFNARFTFLQDEEFTNWNRLLFLNIKSLSFSFTRDIIPGELNWLQNLPWLQSLSLTPGFPNFIPFEKLNSNSVRELEESFSANMPLLNMLDIEMEIFESTRIHRWPEYLPNLTELHISNCKIIPHDLISQLTVLGSLSHLVLDNLPTLSDTAFTADCLNRFVTTEGDPSTSLAPAISCFKSLKVLELRYLLLSTDACVSNGIAKSQSLEKLIIHKCENMTKDSCLHLIQCEVEFEV